MKHTFLWATLISSAIPTVTQPINIAVISIPKCGTHLLTKCISLLTGKVLQQRMDFTQLPTLENDNQYFMVHIPYSSADAAALSAKKFHCFFIYRDPRDQIVSLIIWIREHPNFYPKLSKLSFDQLFKLILFNGVPERPTWGKGGLVAIYHSFLAWKHVPNFYTLCFEDLVGPLGGGTADSQVYEINNIAHHADVTLTPVLLKYCISRLFGTRTFREGQIGGWKKHFQAWHKELFKQRAGQLLVDLRYEKDLNW